MNPRIVVPLAVFTVLVAASGAAVAGCQHQACEWDYNEKCSYCKNSTDFRCTWLSCEECLVGPCVTPPPDPTPPDDPVDPPGGDNDPTDPEELEPSSGDDGWEVCILCRRGS